MRLWSYESINSDAGDHAFEDNRAVPTFYSMQYLRGRRLCASNTQDFSAEWIFQRAVNRFLQLPIFGLENEGWYFVRVDGENLDHGSFPGNAVVAFAVILSPALFPIIFGSALIALTVLSPFVVWHLRSFPAKVLRRAPQENGDVWPPTREVVEELDPGNLGQRYSYLSIFRTMISSLFYCVCGTLPWFFIKYGQYSCTVNADCRETLIHSVPLVVFGPWCACAIAAFRWTHKLNSSACDCACERAQNDVVRDKTYGKAVANIVEKLANEKDKLSFFPIFVKSENEEPDDAPLTWLQWALLLLGPCLHGVLPQLWMAFQCEEEFPPLRGDCLTLAIIWVGILAQAVELRLFFTQFLDAILEFDDVMDQLYIFLMMTSKIQTRRKANRLRSLEDIIVRNDKYRRRLEGTAACKTEGERFFMEEHSIQLIDYSPADDDATQLSDLWLMQVAFNFKTKDGLRLYRAMRKWLTIDILNERFEIERYVSLAAQLCIGFLLILGSTYLTTHHITSSWTVLPMDTLALAYLILRGLNACVHANEYMFDKTNQALLDWQDDVWHAETSLNVEEPAIGWIWNTAKNISEPLPFDGKLEELDRTELSQCFDLCIKRIETLEERQRILGVEVTRSLRNRVAASLLSALLALASKVPDLIHKNATLITEVVNRANHVRQSIIHQ